MEIAFSLHGIGSFALYFWVALVAEAVFLILYMAVTPHHEADLIRAGNAAAAVSLAGAVIGFTLPLASAVMSSVSLLDMTVWAVVALVVQIAVFLLTNIVLRDLSRRIEENNLAAGITLATASVSIGILNAACMT